MSHDWTSKPHIRIPPNNVRRNPRKPRQPPISKGIEKDARQCGKALLEQLDETVRYCNRPEKIVSEDEVFFVLHTEHNISYRERVLERFNLRLSVQIDEYSALVSLHKSFLERLRSAFVTYMKTSNLRSYVDEINSISKAEYDRISPDLNEWLETSESPMCVEIRILPNLGEGHYTQLIERLVSFLGTQDARVVGSRIREKDASLRAYVKPQTVKMIAQGVDSVWQASQAPRIVIGKPQSLDIKEKPTPKPPNTDAKTICVLDTGVDSNQPFLRRVLVDAVDLTSDGLAQDSHGHGTFVAGLAAYGELENRADPRASARIISAKVLGNDSAEYPYLESRLEEAVRRFHDHTKIFNLSVMYPQHCNMSQPTDLAYTIDKLSRDYNVSFVVCTGNLEDEIPSLVASLPYPSYFGDLCCRAYGGAEACSSVTVGGVAKKDSDRAIAKVGQPSPFTRRGETL